MSWPLGVLNFSPRRLMALGNVSIGPLRGRFPSGRDPGPPDQTRQLRQQRSPDHGRRKDRNASGPSHSLRSPTNPVARESSQKGDPSAPLWIGIGTLGRGEAIDYGAARMMLRRAAHRAGLRKAINPHIFRHSRASSLASKLTEAHS